MSLEAKSISLNDLIAAEKQSSHPSIIHPEYSATKDLGLLQLPTRTKIQRHKISSDIDKGKKTSSLKFKKTFLIKSPLTPKKLKYLQKPSYKRKNLTTKRDTQGSHVKINQKYIPLLRNIGVLFDNILSSDSSETNEFRRRKHKRNPFSNKKDNICTCPSKDNTEESYTQEETVTYSSDPSNEIENTPLTATPSADNTIYDNFGRFRRNKNIPILFARNPFSLRRNDTELSEGSGSAYNRCNKGHISRDNGNNECSTRNGDYAPFSEDYEENTYGYSRNDASSLGSTRGEQRIGINTQSTETGGGTNKNYSFILPAHGTSKNLTGEISEHERQIKLQVRKDETESPVFLSELTSGLRGNNTQEENIPKRNTEEYEKSIPNNISSDKRISYGNGQITTENKKIRRANETVGPKVVMIFDGYSVARDVNGKNKMTERAIHIHS
ncbi:uncharacterized protein LOC116767058 [Danaus plexippus]|uniref:uncharacterized protein LOC116767058 n=1 Tax=Danaus plexippus TaxID=13037 RepID=UPI002AB17D3C|nr:uncharacterized protein LOC116767058 [Danaus plexippus]